MKITKNKSDELKENNEVENPVDGFLAKDNISGLAHHYAKSDEEGKKGIIDKATAAKGDVFAQRIKVRAKNILENNVDSEDELLETTSTGSVGGQYSSKYFLDPSHGKNPPSIFKGGTVIKPNDKQHTSGINSFTVVKGKLKEDIFTEIEKMIDNTITPQKPNQPSIPIVDEDMGQSMSDNSNFNEIPRDIVKLANKLDGLIKQCVDSTGDPVGVYDNSSTWQQEYIYEVNLVKNRLIIQSKDGLGKADYPETFGPKWDGSVTSEAKLNLQHIIKNYNRTIKGLPKRQTDIDTEFQDNELDEDSLNELSPETYKSAADKATLTGRKEKGQRLYTDGAFKQFIGLKTCFGTIEKIYGIESNGIDYFVQITDYSTQTYTFCFTPKLNDISEVNRDSPIGIIQEPMDRRTANIFVKLAQAFGFTRQLSVHDFKLNNEGGMNEIDINTTIQSAPQQQVEPEENFTTESLYDIYEKVCNDTGVDSEESNKLKNVLIEFGDYDNPNTPVNSLAIDEFKRILPETTGASASSGQYNGPLQGRPLTPADEIFEDDENFEDNTFGDEENLEDNTFEDQENLGEPLKSFSVPQWAVGLIVHNSKNGLSNEQIQEVSHFIANVGGDYGSTNFKETSNKDFSEGDVIIDLYPAKQGVSSNPEGSMEEDTVSGPTVAMSSQGLDDQDFHILGHEFGSENVKKRGNLGQAYIADITCNGATYTIAALGKDTGNIKYVLRHQGYKDYESFNSLDELINAIKSFDQDDNNQNNVHPENIQFTVNEDALSPAIANLKRIHAETEKITKSEMQKVKSDTLKANTADGTQFIDNTKGVESSDSDNAIGIDNTPQQDAIDLISKGMEDLEYNGDTGEDFDERFEENIDPDLSTDAVTDQFGHKTPADKMVNVLKTNTGKNILDAVKQKKKDNDEPMYSKDPQPVKIVKEDVYMETDDFIITEKEHKEMLAEATRMKAMMDYSSAKAISTKGNKVDNSLFKRKK